MPQFNNAASPASRRWGGRLWPVVILLAWLAVTLLATQASHAADFVVSATNDSHDAAPGDGLCVDSAGACTLRAAIEEANALTGTDTITLTAAARYTLTLGQLDVDSEVIVAGEGATISANGASRVFYVAGTGNLSLRDVTVRDGAADVGGGILVDWGGVLNVLDSAIVSNATTGNGGGISNFFGILNIANSTVSGNRANGEGGGIHQYGFGGAGTGNLTNVTITGNRSDADDVGGGDGGGVYTLSTLLNLKNSIIAGNSVGATGYITEPDCLSLSGLATLGYNLVGATNNSTIFPPGAPNGNNDFVGAYNAPLDPLLGGLTGDPPHHPLLLGSLAIDQIPAASSTFASSGVNPLFADGDPLTLDQRGAPRASGPGQGGSAADIGAYEYDSTPTAITLARFEAIPGEATIRLEWETASELDNLGFNLYRSLAPDGEYALLNGALIPGLVPGSPGGAVYTWLDEDVEPGVTYYYKLQDVDIYGQGTLYGPVWATVAEGQVFSVYLPLVVH